MDNAPRNVARAQWVALCAVVVSTVLALVHREWLTGVAGVAAVAGWTSALMSTERWHTWQTLAYAWRLLAGGDDE